MVFQTKWMWAQCQAYSRDYPKPFELDFKGDYEAYIVACERWTDRFNAHVSMLRKVEVEDAKAQAYLKVIKDAEAMYLRQRVDDGDFEGMPELEEIYSKIKNRRGNGGALYRYYWVTVNCQPAVQLADLQAKINKYVHRKIIKRAEWCIEQRGKSDLDMGTGMHLHMLVEQSGSLFLGDFTRNTRNTFKTLVGNDLAVHVLGCKSEKDVEARRKYMEGDKQGKNDTEREEKRQKCEIDKVWRLKNNLLPMYKHDNGEDDEEAHTEEGSQDHPSEDLS